MEAGCLEEPAWSWAQRGQQEGSAQRQEESGQRLPELGDACVGAAEPQQPQLPPGKLKKTALKLFGGKRSICTLPSFFGGRSKGQGKATSKKGLSKCQTHDGLSAAVCDKGGTTQPESPLEGSSDSQACLLPSSQSAHMALAPSTKLNLGRRDSSPPGSIEGGEKKPTGEKSSCPRAKKGLRGFFNSIRRHRKSKAAEGEKAELAEWNGALEKAVKAPGVGLASEGAVEGRGLGAAPLPAAVPGSADDDGSVGTAADCGEAAQPSALPVDGGSSEGDAEVLAGRGDVPGTTSKADAVVCAEFDNSNQLLAFHPDFLDTDPACLHSGDLLNLILGDVASLKSFDSLTGCGDDIAEPDIAESTLSVGHSRDAAKRSSCLVTFQGGGEEMAIPEEAEDFLPEPWDSRAAEDRSYGAQVLRSSLETHASHEAAVLPYVGEAMDGLDLLTPQSDQQESAPNSDEGYYDSTTPGLEDEAGDGLGELKKDRLPRDSYSGDALYEFDALMSPSHREESLFESKVSRPEIFSCFLDLCLPAEESLVQMLDQKRGLMETEEERLVAIQKELLYWELQREPVMKRLVVPNKEKCPREKPCIECESRAASCVGKNQSSLGREQVGSHPPPRCANDGGLGAQAEDPEWRDFPWTPCPETCYGSQKAQGSCLIQLPQENAGFDLDLDHELSGGSIQGGAAPAEAGVFPGCRLPEQERSDRADAPGEPAVCSEPEHTCRWRDFGQEAPAQALQFAPAERGTVFLGGGWLLAAPRRSQCQDCGPRVPPGRTGAQPVPELWFCFLPGEERQVPTCRHRPGRAAASQCQLRHREEPRVLRRWPERQSPPWPHSACRECHRSRVAAWGVSRKGWKVLEGGNGTRTRHVQVTGIETWADRGLGLGRLGGRVQVFGTARTAESAARGTLRWPRPEQTHLWIHGLRPSCSAVLWVLLQGVPTESCQPTFYFSSPSMLPERISWGRCGS
ncbi:APC membrane recruitment protein 1 isoform X3 [Cuculus canorus]|uniref:APC membrane recruitment protein 1 isoform X3 n=1 Tax=Cuculus canorus TaxID=55661 RepID=UPI0023AB0CEC|nr:APC membrane recruitment protein 1 isoform X3 [Cuculus canorus]